MSHPKHQNSDKVSLVHYFYNAAKRNDIPEMRKILDSVDEEDREYILNGRTEVYTEVYVSELSYGPLKVALEFELPEAALYLINNGANILKLSTLKSDDTDALSYIAWLTLHKTDINQHKIDTTIIDALMTKKGAIDAFCYHFPNFMLTITDFYHNTKFGTAYASALDSIKKTYLVSFGKSIGVSEEETENLCLIEKSIYGCCNGSLYADLHESWMERFNNLRSTIESVRNVNDPYSTSTFQI